MCCLITEWDDEAGTVDEILRFAQKLGLSIDWSGAQTEIRPTRDEPKWRAWLRPGIFFPVLLAILGGVEALKHHHAWLLAKPESVVRAKPAELNLLADTPGAVELITRNTSPIGACRTRVVQASVGLDAALRQDPIAVSVGSDLAGWSKPLLPGESEREVFELPALPIGRHSAYVDQAGRSGMLRRDALRRATIAVQVWRDVEIVLRGTDAQGERCVAFLDLRVGRGGAGAKLEVMATGARVLVTEFVRMSTVTLQPAYHVGTGKGLVSVQEVQLPALENFSVHGFNVRLAGSMRSPQEWERLCQQLAAEITFKLL